MTDYTSKLIKGASVIFLASIFSSILGYLIRIILARKLTTEEFGLFFAIYSVVLMIGWLKGFGVGHVLPKFIPEFHVRNEQDKIKSTFAFVFIFSLLSSIFFLFLLFVLPEGLINNYFKSHLAKTLLLILFTFVCVDGLSKIVSGFFISRHFSFLYSLRQLVFRLAIIILLLVITEVDIFSASLVYVAAALLGLVINFVFFFRHFSFFRYKASITKKLIKRIFKFSTPFIFRNFFDFFMTRVDTLVLVYFRPLVDVAIYNAILPTVEVLLLFGRPFGSVMFPLSSELWALNKKERIRFLLKMVHKYVFLLSIPFGIGIYFFSTFILKTFFGVDYALGSIGLKILAIGFSITGLDIVSNAVLMGIGRPKESVKISISRNIVNFVLNIVLIPLFGNLFNQGYLGAIIATTFCMIFSFSFYSYYLYKYLSYCPPLKNFLYILISGFLSLTAGYVFIKNISNVYAQIGVFILVLGVFYILFLFVFNVVSKKEIRNMINLLLKRKKY